MLLLMRERLLTNREEAPVFLSDFSHLARKSAEGTVWSDAIEAALSVGSTLVIPPSDVPYLIDRSILVPSRRRIVAHGARICLCRGVTVLMLRNQNVFDGSYLPTPPAKDHEITVEGGIWEDVCTRRMGYGHTGKIDESHSMPGVSTLFLFSGVENLVLRDLTFRNAGGFAVQIGKVKNAVVEDVTFEGFFADGIHVNGNTENLLCRRIAGHVGDDLVALNAYDWPNSAIEFGAIRNVLCEDLTLSPDSPYQALRLEAGRYPYRDGTEGDCALEHIILRRVRGIRNIKVYYQTPRYRVSEGPIGGGVGRGDGILIEDWEADVFAPIDDLPVYTEQDPVAGGIAAIEFGTDLGTVHLKNVNITLHTDQYPLSRAVLVGPKSCRLGEWEVFDPTASSRVECLILEGVTVNGRPITREDVGITVFDAIYPDAPSTGRGSVGEVKIL